MITIDDFKKVFDFIEYEIPSTELNESELKAVYSQFAEWQRQTLPIDCVINLLLCGMCDKETEHEQISPTSLKCLECGNIAVE